MNQRVLFPILSIIGAVTIVLTILSTPAPSAPAKTEASDWPQWRGPNRDGISPDTGLMKSWPKDGPPLAWKIKGLGEGYSSVSVGGGRIYTMGDTDVCNLYALDAKDGKVIWKAKIGQTGGDYPGPRATPTVDGDMIYTLGQFGDLVCVDTSGKEIWRKSYSKDFGGSMPHWGFAESPLIDGDNLICTPGGKDGAMVALKKTTGEVVWRSKGFTDSAAYSSVVACDLGNVHQYVQLTASHVAGIAADSGKTLWSAPRSGKTAVIPTPIVHNDLVFVTSGYGVGCNCFKISVNDGKFAFKEIYANNDMQVHHGGVVRVGDYVYGASDPGILKCMKLATGEVVWKERVVKGALSCADGKLYLRNEGGAGTVYLIEASPDGYKEISHFDQPNRSRTNAWSHPAIADGKLYLRDADTLLCYDIKAK